MTFSLLRGRRAVWLLLALLAAGGGARFWRLSDRGLFSYDEGFLAQAAKGPAVAFRWAARALLDGEPLTREGLREAFAREGFPYPYVAAKHGYAALVCIGMALGGPRDAVPLAVSAFLGTASLLWTWRIGRLLGGGVGAAASATFLTAFSPNHIFFSRSGFSHASSVFFVLWALWVYLSHARRAAGARPLGRTGFLAGAAFLCHYNTVWLPFVLGAAEAAFPSGQGGARARRLLALATGFAAPLAICEAATWITKGLGGGWLPGVATYGAELLRAPELMTSVFSRARISSLYYVLHTVRSEGILWTALLVASAVPLAARRAGDGLTVLACLAVIYLFYSLSGFKACRTLLAVFPLGAIAIGAAVGRMHPRARGAVAALVALQGVLVLPAVTETLSASSPYPALAAAARREGKRLLAVDDYPVVDFYQGGNHAVFVRDAAAFRDLASRDEGGWRLLVVNRGGRYGFEDPVWTAEGRYALVEEIVRSRAPAAVVPYSLPLVYEYADPIFSWRRLFVLDAPPSVVEVYDLDDAD